MATSCSRASRSSRLLVCSHTSGSTSTGAPPATWPNRQRGRRVATRPDPIWLA